MLNSLRPSSNNDHKFIVAMGKAAAAPSALIRIKARIARRAVALRKDQEPDPSHAEEPCKKSAILHMRVGAC
jgi:hypothetical protein